MTWRTRKKDTYSWEQRKLREFGKATGGTTIESEFVEDGNYKVISIGSYSETSKYNDQGLRTRKTLKTENRILNKDDLTMILNDKTSAGNIIGRVLLIDSDNSYVYNQRTERIEVYKEEFEPTFLYQLLNADNIRSKIIKASQGNTQIYVNWSVISELNYQIPKSKLEQNKIATFFDNLDNLITLHQRKYEKLQKLKKAMLEKMFPKPGCSVPEIRFQGFTDDWEQRKLGELASLITKGTTPLDKSNTGVVNFVKIESIDESSGNITITQKISLDEHNGYLRRSQLKENDILFSIAGTLGRVTSVNKSILPANTNQALAIIRLKDGYLDYVKTYLKGKAVADFIKKNPTIGAQPNLSLEQVANLEIAIPSVPEQIQIGAFFKHLDHLITLHQRKLEKLKNLKKACLEKMFV